MRSGTTAPDRARVPSDGSTHTRRRRAFSRPWICIHTAATRACSMRPSPSSSHPHARPDTASSDFRIQTRPACVSCSAAGSTASIQTTSVTGRTRATACTSTRHTSDGPRPLSKWSTCASPSDGTLLHLGACGAARCTACAHTPRGVRHNSCRSAVPQWVCGDGLRAALPRYRIWIEFKTVPSAGRSAPQLLSGHPLASRSAAHRTPRSAVASRASDFSSQFRDSRYRTYGTNSRTSTFKGTSSGSETNATPSQRSGLVQTGARIRRFILFFSDEAPFIETPRIWGFNEFLSAFFEFTVFFVGFHWELVSGSGVFL